LLICLIKGNILIFCFPYQFITFGTNLKSTIIVFKMRKISIVRIFVVIILCYPVSALIKAQNGNEIVVVMSKEKTIINGKTFYLHTVKKGENIYRISKAYGVTQKDIFYSNPDALSGIKEGQILKIPTDPSTPRNIQQIESDKFIFHITEEGQNVFQLTQQYKISKEELYKYNPELEVSSLQVGQVVRIPKSANVAPEADKIQIVQSYVDHKVKRKETKYAIAKEYNITVDELIAANPILNTEDLQPGQVLRVPVKTKTEIVPVPVAIKKDTVTKPPVIITTDYPVDNPVTNPLVTKPCGFYKAFSETYNVALLLPLFLEENETLVMIDSANLAKEGAKRSLESSEIYQRTANILEFYQGALLAIDSLKRAGMSLKLYTYDTGKDTQKITRILNRPEMAKMDLIIGPFFTEAVEKVAPFALKNQIKLVSPVSVNSNMLKNNPYVFQIIPNDSVNGDAMLNFIATYPNKNIVLINSNKQEDKAMVDLYRKKLMAVSPNFKEYHYRANNSQPNFYLADKVDNLVVIPSGDLNIINDVFSQLNTAAKTYSIKVFGLPVCTMFKNVRQDYFYNLEFHYYTSFYIDYDASNIKNFLFKYKKYYNTQPYYHNKENYPYQFTKEGFNFAFLGYDATFYFLECLGRSGKNFENCLDTQKYEMLHTNLNFQRINPSSGWLNKGVNILKYSKDFYITKVF
jgi:LysM repeat protein/ABC-type branched-subunit amino acid transport system substrate-binding protein